MLALRPAWRHLPHSWVTLDSVDTRSLLSSERMHLAHGPTQRSARNFLRNLPLAWRIVRRMRPAAILTTGSGLAVPFAWVGRALGARVVYIECGGRADRPSLACRMIAPIAFVTYVQWPQLEHTVPRTRYVGRIGMAAASELVGAARSHTTDAVEVFATVGTCPVKFDRLIRAVDELPTGATLIQTGVSRLRTARARTVDFLPFDELIAYMSSAAVVITHAGVGSVLLALALGKRPIVVPRRADLGEQVDDHQQAFAHNMAREGLITLVEDPHLLASVLANRRESAPPSNAGGDDGLCEDLHVCLRGLAG